jgi:hypothetical protein
MTKRGPPSKSHLKEVPREIGDAKDEEKKEEDEEAAKKAVVEEDQYTQLVQVCM